MTSSVKTILNREPRREIQTVKEVVEETLEIQKRQEMVRVAEEAFRVKEGMVNSLSLRKKLTSKTGLKMSKQVTIRLVKHKFMAKWRRVKTIEPYVNSATNRILREAFALFLASERLDGKVTINFDQCSFRDMCTVPYSWVPQGNPTIRSVKQSGAGFTLLLAVGSDGSYWFSFIEGPNN